MAAEHRDRPYSYFWAEGGAQPGLESNFGVGGYGYPALIALAPAKARYANLRAGFSEGAVRSFMESTRLVSEAWGGGGCGGPGAAADCREEGGIRLAGSAVAGSRGC